MVGVSCSIAACLSGNSGATPSIFAKVVARLSIDVLRGELTKLSKSGSASASIRGD